MIYKYRGKMETACGRVIDIAAFSDGDVCWSEIVHSLGNICRYQGHCKRFFSVLSHSVLSYLIAKKLWPEDEDIQIAALIHDAAEAFVGDIISPVRTLPGMIIHKKHERKVAEAIFEAALLDKSLLDDERLKIADNIALVNEVKRLMSSKGDLPIWEPDFKKYTNYVNKVRVGFLDFLKARLFSVFIFHRAMEKHYARKIASRRSDAETTNAAQNGV